MKISLFALTVGLALLCACTSSTESELISDPNHKPISSETEQLKDSVAALPKILSQENYASFLLDYLSNHSERRFELTTRLGTIKVRLFEDTPLHTANFLMLINRDYFNRTEFTRVAKKFVVQGGNNDSELEEIKRILIGSYLIEPEFREQHIHMKGALAMARDYKDNPGKLSSSYNFYFVQGQVFNEPQLLGIERENEIKIPKWKRDIYETIGGAPHLDGEHTVFGEVYEGLEVLERMSLVKTDESEWPIEPLIMEVEILP